MKRFTVSYVDTRNDEMVVLEFDYSGQATNAFNGLSHLDHVANLSMERNF